MGRVLTCLTVEHDYRLVALAVSIAAVGALVSFKIFSHVASSHGLRRLSLLLLTGICSGSGIWATHFIAMLAYDAGFPIAYEPVATAGSFLLAVAATTIGFTLASGDLSPGGLPSGGSGGFSWQPGLGGAVIGIGIGLMHFTGMSAMLIPGALHWDTTLVVASLAIGTAFATLATAGYHRWSGRRARWISAGLFALAIVGLHFTAMGAVIIIPDPGMAAPPSPVDAALMASAVSGATLVIMLTGIASMALMENSMRREREQDLRIQNLRFDMALANMGEGLCMFDAQKRLVVCNSRYATMYALPPELVKAGTPHHDIITHRVVNGILKGEASLGAADRMLAALHAVPDDAPSSRIDELTDGRLINVKRQPMAGGGWVATHLDVTEQRRSEAKIIHMAHHDALTDLPNRVLFRERLEHAFARVRRGSRHQAVLMLDLDRFKDINDTHGHLVGDMLLKAVATRLRACIRKTATVARLGGDEFAILEEVEDPILETTRIAERIHKRLGAPFDLGDYQVVTGASIGIAIAPGDGIDSEEILKNADLALYRAKGSGRGTHRFFEPEMDRIMQVRRDLEQDIRGALINGGFELHYQPFADLKTGEISGCEALLRWHHPKRGMIQPAEFIALAEETGLIVPLGEWVLKTACAEAAKWSSDLAIAVNLSPVQFRNQNLVSTVAGALEAAGIAAQRLELEVTESAIIQDSEIVFATLGRLQELGARIALDDFGTGYSSLSFLQKFPFDKIKIDRAFVSKLWDADDEARRIARAVVRFAVSLGKVTTAEGVETKEQLEFLCAEDCTEMQGYYFSRPQRSSDFLKMAATRVKVPATAA
jgi:diguanylate cyclase (GGDEF)-like protein